VERELARLEHASPAARALMLENLSVYMPYECQEEIAQRWSQELFARDPLPFTRMQVARVRALSKLDPRVASAALERVAALPDARIDEYQALPGERPAPKHALRALAQSLLDTRQVRELSPLAKRTPESSLWSTDELRLLVPDEERSERLGVLALELDAITNDSSDGKWKANYLGLGLAVWAAPTDAARMRDAIEGWLFRSGHLRVAYEIDQLAVAGFRLDAIALERRFALARRVVAALPPVLPSEPDGALSFDQRMHATAWLFVAAAEEGVPLWEDARVCGWLENELESGRVDMHRTYDRASTGRVWLELLRFHKSGAPGADEARGRALLHRLRARIDETIERWPRPFYDAVFAERLLVASVAARWYRLERELGPLADHALELALASDDGNEGWARAIAASQVALAVITAKGEAP
jgi:hypothetical protein